MSLNYGLCTKKQIQNYKYNTITNYYFKQKMMNKFTFMCCLAGSISLPALANTGDKITSLDQLSNSKCYTITPMENDRGTWFFKSENPKYLYSTGKTGTAVDANSQNQQFAFLKSASGKYYIYSIGGQKFLSYIATEGGCVSLLDRPYSPDSYTTFVASTSTQKADYPWVVALNGHHVGISNGYTYGIITSYNNTNDKGNCISITEATDFDATEALKRIEDFERAYTEENIALAAAANDYLRIPQKAVGGYDPALWEKLNEICGGDGKADFYDAVKPEFQEALQALHDAPLTEGVFSNNKVYLLQNLTTSNGYLYSKQEENISRVYSSAKASNLPTVENSEYWQLCTAYGYSVLYNQGTKSYAHYDAVQNQWVLSTTPAFVDVKRNQAKGAASFCIQDIQYTGINQYLHVNNGYETGVVAWNTQADASNFFFVEQDRAAVDIDMASLILPLKRQEAETIINNYVEGKSNYIGNYSSESINTLKALLNNPGTTLESLLNAIDQAKNSIKQPEADKYYYIQSTMVFNDGTTKAIYENPDGSNVGWRTVAQSPAELWQLEADGNGKYYIKSANTGKYLQLTPAAATGTIGSNKGSAFTLEQKDNCITLALIHYTSNDKATLSLQRENKWGTLAKPEDENGSYIGTYNAYSETTPTKWNIIEASDVKITIGETGYATTWLPYAISLENTNVEAYAVSKVAHETATLEKVAGTLPARSSVILHGDAGTYSFPIETGDHQAPANSQLQGTSIATTIDTGINAYILGNGGHGIGLYQMDADDRTLEANKAYLVLPASASGIRSITIGGPTTGISETLSGNVQTEEYYDLQGRRTTTPKKGIYVTKSGKKIVFNK